MAQGSGTGGGPLRRDAQALFDSLYIGGGTPSLLGEERLARLFEALHRHFTFSTDAEITAEANPDDATRSSLSFMKSLGVNRLSLGIQSFDDRDLAFLKRRHDSARAQAAIGAARDAGFSNIGLDLIYGLPNQTNKAWTATLEQAVSFRPAHISCYLLTVEGEAPLAAMAREGEVRLPGEERVRSLFLLTSRFLESRGFIHYEVSNFAASEGLICRHNDKYWSHAPYLGLGPAAHSFDGKPQVVECAITGSVLRGARGKGIGRKKAARPLTPSSSPWKGAIWA